MFPSKIFAPIQFQMFGETVHEHAHSENMWSYDLVEGKVKNNTIANNGHNSNNKFFLYL